MEAALFEGVNDLFGLSTTVTLYDLTNTYFEGGMASNPKAQRGHSKEKRTDCPLVTLGLVLDGSSFVRRSEVFEGNVSEGQTLEEMLEGLGAPAQALVIMDRGIATEANLTWLKEKGYRYLVVSRERTRHFDPERAICIQNAAGESLQLEKVLSEDGDEVRLYCHSERRARKEEAINERFAQRFEQALDRIAEGLSKPRTTKHLDKLWERIGRLKEKSRGVAQHYEIELIPDEQGEKAVALRYTRQPAPGGFYDPPRRLLPALERDRLGRGAPVVLMPIYSDPPMANNFDPPIGAFRAMWPYPFRRFLTRATGGTFEGVGCDSQDQGTTQRGSRTEHPVDRPRAGHLPQYRPQVPAHGRGRHRRAAGEPDPAQAAG